MTEILRVPSIFLVEHSGTLGMCRAAIEICRKENAVLVCDARMRPITKLLGIGILGLDWPNKVEVMKGMEKLKERLVYPIFKLMGVYETAYTGGGAIAKMLDVVKKGQNMVLFPSGITTKNAPWAPGARGLVAGMYKWGIEAKLNYVTAGNLDYQIVPDRNVNGFMGDPRSVASEVEKRYFEVLESKNNSVLVPMTE